MGDAAVAFRVVNPIEMLSRTILEEIVPRLLFCCDDDHDDAQRGISHLN